MAGYVGIDVAQQTLAICLQPQGRTWVQPNTPAGHRQLIAELLAVAPAKILLEATGGYERAVLRSLCAAGLPAVRVQPRQIKHLAKALGRQAKSDPLDAELLADAAQVLAVPVRPAPDPDQETLRALVDLRTDLVGQRDDNRRRLKQAEQLPVQRTLQRVNTALQREIARLEREIRSQLATLPEPLSKAPGLGPILRATLAARLPELGRLDRRQIAGLVGLAPYNNDSGKHQGKRHITGGRGDIRRVLYMATWASIRARSVLADTYRNLIARGKPKKVALVACMRKFLTMLNAMARDNAKWTPRPAQGAV